MDLITRDRILCLLTGMAIPVLMFIGLVFWTGEENFDGSEPTIEISCRLVILSPGDYPEEVVHECREKFIFFKEKDRVLV